MSTRQHGQVHGHISEINVELFPEEMKNVSSILFDKMSLPVAFGGALPKLHEKDKAIIYF